MPRRRRRRVRRPPPAASRALPPFLRRRSNKWLIAALATLGLGLLLGRCFPGSGSNDASEATPTVVATTVVRATEPTTVGTPSLALPDIAPDAALLERAQVVNIVDGDTIDVELDGETERVRYYGSDTPERGAACFDEASARNESLAGQTVLLLPDARDRDRFGRLLRYVFAEDGASIDAQMIAEGYAHAWTEDGAYREQLIALESEARAAGVGCLWESGVRRS